VQLTAGVIHLVALAERIQAVALSRVQLPRERKRVQHAAIMLDRLLCLTEPLELVVDEPHIERRVVNNELCTLDEGEKRFSHLVERRLVLERLLADAVHGEGCRIDMPIRAYVLVEMPTGQSPILELDTADLDDAMPLLGLETGRFGVKNDLTHV
jgi:hypothetical protein